MSYYQFQGPVQGGGFGPDDDDMRRRRRHYRDAGAPYSGGRTQTPFEKIPEYEVQVTGAQQQLQAPKPGPQWGAPRSSVAVDMGQGPVQLPESPPDFEGQHAVQEQKDLAQRLFDDNKPAYGSAGLSRKPGVGEFAHYDPHQIISRAPEEDVHPPVPRAPKRDPEPVPEPGPLGPVPAPAGRPPPRPPALPEIVSGPAVHIPSAPKPTPLPVVVPPKQPRLAMPPKPQPPPEPHKIPQLLTLPSGRGRRPIGGGESAPPQPPVPPPPYVPDSAMGPQKPPRRRVSWGKDEERRFTGGSFTPGRIQDWVPEERARHQGYRQLGQHQGREMARREHQITLDDMQRRNRGIIGRLTQQGGALVQQLGEKEQRVGQLLQEGRSLESTSKKRIARLQQGMGREGLRAQRAEQRVGQLLQEGRSLESTSKKQIRGLQQGMGREGLRAQKAQERVGQLLQEGRGLEAEHKRSYGALKTDANRRIQELEKKINDGSADREAAQKEIDTLTAQLAAASRKPEAKQDQDGLNSLRSDIADLRAAMKRMPREKAAAQQAPIVVQGGAGGGGASSSAGGSSASSGGGGAAPAAAPDLSKIVEAVKQIAASKGAAKGAKGGSKGITQARRTYTDKRKAKIAELRALKSKRIREFASKTKKLPKAERLKQRREYKKKVESQFKEAQTRFPTARGLKSVGVIRELVRKLDAFKLK